MVLAVTPEQAHERRWWTLGALCLSLSIIGIDNTILNVALPKIVGSVGAEGSQLQWIVDSYVIVFACLAIVALTSSAANAAVKALCTRATSAAGSLAGRRRRVWLAPYYLPRLALAFGGVRRRRTPIRLPWLPPP